MTRDEAETIAWLMALVVVVLTVVIAAICVIHRIWWGLAADLALSGTLAGYAHFYDRARKRRRSS